MGNIPNSIIMGQGVDDFKGIFGTTHNLHEKFGKIALLMYFAEEATTGIGIGASLNGLYPIQTHIREILCIGLHEPNHKSQYPNIATCLEGVSKYQC